jgi:hypothetical protein
VILIIGLGDASPVKLLGVHFGLNKVSQLPALLVTSQTCLALREEITNDTLKFIPAKNF